MPARLRPSPVPDARSPLAGLRLRGWVHAGTIPLDGVLMDRSRAGPDWRARLRPWLEHAMEARAHGDLVLVLFGAPLVRDCAALGPCLPVLRRSGLLATVPFAEPEPALAQALRGHLVHVAAGQLAAVPLAGFADLDVAGWWALDGVAVVRAERVPALRPAAPPRRIASAPALPAGAEPFAPMRAALTRRPRRRLRHALGDLGRSTRRVLGGAFGFLWRAYLVLLLLMIAGGMGMGLVETVRTAAERGAGEVEWGGLLVPLLTGLAVVWFVFRRRTAGRLHQQGSPAQPASAAAGGPPRSPVWRRAAAWLAWRSPYAAHLRRLYARRLVEVERLFAAGRIEEALHRAIGLGGPPSPQGAFADLPLTGPGLRRSLALDLGPVRSIGLGLDPTDEARLKALYREQAVALGRAGETDRAAFVLDELVGDPHAAMRLLAEAGRVETAARLAEARRLGPGVVVPLWFRAGRPERALALAARHDAHAELWKELKPGDPFRPVLAEAWAERLAAAGAFDRAAALAREVPGLAGRRAAWIGLALAAESPPRSEALARALRALPWEARDGDPLHAAFAALLAEPGAAGAARRRAVAALWLDPDFEGGPPRPPGPAFALLCRGLARRLAADDGAMGHDPERARLAGHLAEAGAQVALRQHLRRLRTRPAPPDAPAAGPLAIPDGPALAGIADVALLAGGRVLVGHRSGLVRLLGRGGRERWRGQVEGLVGFATLAEGDRAFVLRRTLEGIALLLFDPGAGRLAPLGRLSVAHWHPHADETGWLVFDGDGFARLDTASLLARPDAVGDATEAAPIHHWRVPVTEPGRPLALAAFADGYALVHARHDGLVEWWSLVIRTLAVTCRFWTPPPCPDGAVLGLMEGVAWSLDDAGPHPALRAHPHAFTPATRENERALIAATARAEPRTLPRLVATENGRLWAAADTAEGMLWVDVPGSNASRGPAVTWRGSRALRTRFARDGGTAALFDERGRLVVLHPRTGQVMLRLL